MKKKIIQTTLLITILVLVVAGAFTYAFFDSKGGDVSHVNVFCTNPNSHNKKDIMQAMNLVKESFHKVFSGCTLTDLWYDGGVVNRQEDQCVQQYNGEEVIMLLSNFDVGRFGGDGSLETNSTYSRWNWIVVKSKNGRWQLKAWGY